MNGQVVKLGFGRFPPYRQVVSEVFDAHCTAQATRGLDKVPCRETGVEITRTAQPQQTQGRCQFNLQEALAFLQQTAGAALEQICQSLVRLDFLGGGANAPRQRA